MRLAAVLLALVGAVTAPAPASAEAMPCLHRGRQHVVQHANGNVDADSRWHVLHGEPPTCEPGRSSDTESWEQRQDKIDRERHRRSIGQDDGKSRYCRRHWYC